MEKRLETYCETMKQIIQSNQFPKTINSALSQITATIEIDKVDVSDRVRISNYVLKFLSEESTYSGKSLQNHSLKSKL